MTYNTKGRREIDFIVRNEMTKTDRLVRVCYEFTDDETAVDFLKSRFSASGLKLGFLCNAATHPMQRLKASIDKLLDA